MAYILLMVIMLSCDASDNMQGGTEGPPERHQQIQELPTRPKLALEEINMRSDAEVAPSPDPTPSPNVSIVDGVRRRTSTKANKYNFQSRDPPWFGAPGWDSGLAAQFLRGVSKNIQTLSKN